MSDQNADFVLLREKLGEVSDVYSVVALLHWDQEVCMPPKAGPGRGQQLATLSAIAHRMFTDPSMGDLLNRLGSADLDSDGKALVAETLYDYNKATRLPEDFVEEFAREQSAAYAAWAKARAESNFETFRPNLEKMVELNRRKADLLGYEGSPYNALLNAHERGLTVDILQPIFATLAREQSALVRRILQVTQRNLRWLEQQWNEPRLWDLSIQILRAMGYDFEAGRQDKSLHPFSTNFDIYDVRVTTRFRPDDLFSGLMGSLHEGGHALYEQGFIESDRRSTLASAISLGIHESQSLLWENIIGGSLAFWKYFGPILKPAFPGQVDRVTPEQFHYAVNRVQPSLIRVEADECTYNLHVILRFEIELELIEGRLEAGGVPEVWNQKIKDYLGLDVPDDARGCLQDIHWSHGSFGYFPTYTLGHLYAAQMFERILEDIPDLWKQVEKGDFSPLLEWLRENVHRIGRRKTAAKLIEDISGRPLSPDPYLRYLKQKYTTLYSLDARA